MAERPKPTDSQIVVKEIYDRDRIKQLKLAQITSGMICTARLVTYDSFGHPGDARPDDPVAVDYLVEVTKIPNKVRRLAAYLLPSLAKVSFTHFPPIEEQHIDVSDTNNDSNEETHRINSRGTLSDGSPLIIVCGPQGGLMPPPSQADVGYMLPVDHVFESQLDPVLTEKLKLPVQL